MCLPMTQISAMTAVKLRCLFCMGKMLGLGTSHREKLAILTHRDQRLQPTQNLQDLRRKVVGKVARSKHVGPTCLSYPDVIYHELIYMYICV